MSVCDSNFEYYKQWFQDKEVDIVELSYKLNNTEDFARCDGLVLTGGVDIQPFLYGEPDTRQQFEPYIPERDAFEMKLFAHSQSHHIPLLAICRGLQLVNVLQGGKLMQETGADNIHRKSKGEDKIHEIYVIKNSLLFEMTKTATGKVNSAHHQAASIDSIGNNLMVNAWYMDDNDVKIIEGLEFEDKTGKAFMLAVQWHPERMKDKDSNPLSKNIKERFIKEISK